MVQHLCFPRGYGLSMSLYLVRAVCSVYAVMCGAMGEYLKSLLPSTEEIFKMEREVKVALDDVASGEPIRIP